MSLLTPEQKEFYLREGYLVVKRHVPYGELEAARQGAERIYKKCAYGDYPHCRADKRLSDRFIEKIEHLFHPAIFEKDIFEAVIKSQILDYSKAAMGEDDVFVSFYRMHTTQTYSAWHRDDPQDDRNFTIKATLPLYNECGLYVVPREHRKGPTVFEGVDSKIRGHLPGEVCVPVEAGDILFFHPSIPHRGSCAGRNKYRRAQLHFRVTATAYAGEMPQVPDEWSKRPELLAMADASWREALTKDLKHKEYYKLTTRGAPTQRPASLGQTIIGSRFLLRLSAFTRQPQMDVRAAGRLRAVCACTAGTPVALRTPIMKI